MTFHTGLTFNALRGANTARLPEFKNKHGKPAHANPDGSDWTPAQWLQALIGELGEYAQVRESFEAGFITADEYARLAAQELADVQTYLDILAKRALDTTTAGPLSCAQQMQRLIASLGDFANTRKKLERGDYTFEHYKEVSSAPLASASFAMSKVISTSALQEFEATRWAIGAHPDGIDLGRATLDKFNEVSMCVKSSVRLDANDWHYVTDAQQRRSAEG